MSEARLVREVFERALSFQGDRAEFVKRSCGGDDALEREVLRLLGKLDRAEAFLEGPPPWLRETDDLGVRAGPFRADGMGASRGPGASGAAGRPSPPPATDDPRELVESTGRYRVISEIARGGMGVVYRAERSDGAFQRHVAIKVLIDRARADDDLMRRFVSEREILATLDHPNVARLLDGGALPDGTPFLVMEYLEGEPITTYAAARALTLPARLDLFVAVCDAVQAAHQHLVVHRDIKPTNVLVTPDGTPKLLDFGIAKLLDPARAAWTVAETRSGLQPMTLCYASPEQLTGGVITTATDVHALGVLLYELLTGSHPHPDPTLTVPAWIDAVCSVDPRPPSEILRQGKPGAPPIPHGAVAGDVDHIVLMALRKEPRHRYGSAAELGADVRRYQAGQPVMARTGTFSYRVGKFLRRRRWAVAAVASLVLLTLGFTAGLHRQLRRAELERDRAETVKELLLEIFTAAGPETAEQRNLTALELLERGLARVERGLEDQPEVKAELLAALGRVYHNLGRLDEAARAHGEALRLRRARREAAPLAYADSLVGLANVQVARHDLAAAEAAYREALAVTTSDLGEEDRRAIVCLDGLQSVLSRMGRHREAEAISERILGSTLKRLGFTSVEAALAAGVESPDLAAVASILGGLAAEQRQLGKYIVAEGNFLDALTLSRRVLGEQHYTVAFSLNNLANTHSSRGESALALGERREALALAENVLGARHPAVGAIQLNQGIDLRCLGLFQEARAETLAARGVLAAALGPEHPSTALATSHVALVEASLGAPGPALAQGEDAVRQLVVAHGEDHPDTARARGVLAQVYQRLRCNDEALTLYRRTIPVLERTLGAAHPEALEHRCHAAALLISLGRLGEAREVVEPAVAGFEARPDLVRHQAKARFLLARAGGTADAEARRLAALAKAAYAEIGDPIRAGEVEAWLRDGT